MLHMNSMQPSPHHTHNRHPSIHTDYKQSAQQHYQHHSNTNNTQRHNNLRPPMHHNVHNHYPPMPLLDVSPRSGNSSNGSTGLLLSPDSISPTHNNDHSMHSQYSQPIHHESYNNPNMLSYHNPASDTPSHTHIPYQHNSHQIAAALHADMDTRNEAEREADRAVYMERMQLLWYDQLREVQSIDFHHIKHTLPLARIKKIMKSDEDVRMISAEAPIVFAKACELFILDLTTKAWQQTYNDKRRTLNKGDVANAIANSDIFDFLEPVVPKGSYDSSQVEEAEEWDFNGAVDDTNEYNDNMSYNNNNNTMLPPNAYHSNRIPSNGSSGSSNHSSGSSRSQVQYNQSNYDNCHVAYPTQQQHRANSYTHYNNNKQQQYDRRAISETQYVMQSQSHASLPPIPHHSYNNDINYSVFQPVN